MRRKKVCDGSGFQSGNRGRAQRRRRDSARSGGTTIKAGIREWESSSKACNCGGEVERIGHAAV